MNLPLGDALAIEMLHLFEQLHVLHQDGAARPCRFGVLVIGNRSPFGGGQESFLWSFHNRFRLNDRVRECASSRNIAPPAR